jgi:hypothetical protein
MLELLGGLDLKTLAVVFNYRAMQPLSVAAHACDRGEMTPLRKKSRLKPVLFLRHASVLDSNHSSGISWCPHPSLLLWSVLVRIPPSPLLVEALHHRRGAIRKLIGEFRRSSRNPFPNWRESPADSAMLLAASDRIA